MAGAGLFGILQFFSYAESVIQTQPTHVMTSGYIDSNASLKDTSTESAQISPFKIDVKQQMPQTVKGYPLSLGFTFEYSTIELVDLRKNGVFSRFGVNLGTNIDIKGLVTISPYSSVFLYGYMSMASKTNSIVNGESVESANLSQYSQSYGMNVGTDVTRLYKYPPFSDSLSLSYGVNISYDKQVFLSKKDEVVTRSNRLGYHKITETKKKNYDLSYWQLSLIVGLYFD